MVARVREVRDVVASGMFEGGGSAKRGCHFSSPTRKLGVAGSPLTCLIICITSHPMEPFQIEIRPNDEYQTQIANTVPASRLPYGTGRQRTASSVITVIRCADGVST